jgi:hypothetical protein
MFGSTVLRDMSWHGYGISLTHLFQSSTPPIMILIAPEFGLMKVLKASSACSNLKRCVISFFASIRPVARSSAASDN